MLRASVLPNGFSSGETSYRVAAWGRGRAGRPRTPCPAKGQTERVGTTEVQCEGCRPGSGSPRQQGLGGGAHRDIAGRCHSGH